MTREEKLQLNKDRKRAVKEAWSRERALVCDGKGTVDWTRDQQKELIEKGHVSGFEGQHMKSVNEYPEYAGCVDNIQLLSHDDHLAAHNCSELSDKKGYHSPTNGYYDVKTNTIQSFGNGPPRAPKAIELTNSYSYEYSVSKSSYSNEIDKIRNSISRQQNVSKVQMIDRW